MPRKKKKTKKRDIKFDIPKLLIFASVGIAVLAFSSIYVQQPAVLGDSFLIAKGGDDNSGSGSSGSDDDSSNSGSGSSNSGSGSDDSDDEDDRFDRDFDEIDEDEFSDFDFEDEDEFDEDESGLRIESEFEDDEEEVEVRLSESQRIRTRTKDGFTRIDITEGGIKTRIEYRADRVIIKAELENESEVELEDDSLFKIVERLGEDDIRIATASGNKFLVQRGSSAALTDFPISVDLATNTLFVETPGGSRNLTVLPEQAIQNLIAANVVNRIGNQILLDFANDANLAGVDSLITLGQENDIPLYTITGISDQNLLGFIPVEVEKTVVVSAESGEVLSENLSPLDQIQDLLSF